MVRKRNSSSTPFIAAFVAAAFSLSAGAAFAQTTTSGNAQEQTAPPHHPTHSRIENSRANKKTVKDLTKQLKKEDKQERQANTELSKARDKLAKSTRDLKHTESTERHVASAEHHTARSTHHQRQHATEPRSTSGTGTPQ